MIAIETNSLTKLYGGKGGCREVSLTVPAGKVFGFLGPNGAGKSTLVKMLVGLLKPTSGTARLLGCPLGDLTVRRRIGFLPENFRYHDWMTGNDLLAFHASLYQMPANAAKQRISEVLALAGLAGTGRQRVGTFSKGMQQRIGMAVALLNDPDLLFLDEPTSALDPIGRREVREMIVDLRRAGKTVFLNSHLLSEVELVCDTVAFIKGGRIVASGTLDELLHGQTEVAVRAELTPEAEAAVAAVGRVENREGNRLTVVLQGPEDLPRVAAAIVHNGGKLYELSPRSGSLEDLFVHLIRGEGK